MEEKLNSQVPSQKAMRIRAEYASLSCFLKHVCPTYNVNSPSFPTKGPGEESRQSIDMGVGSPKCGTIEKSSSRSTFVPTQTLLSPAWPGSQRSSSTRLID